MNVPISFAPRTLVSVMRTSIYGGLAAYLAVENAEAQSIVDAIVIGGVLADLVTWLAMTVISLSGNLAHGCYEGFINLLFVFFLFHFSYMGVNMDLEGQPLVIAFLVFMLVLGVKATWYAAAYITQIDNG